jgi:hypothetical protein
LRNKFSFSENKKINPYVDLGAGFTFFSKNINIGNITKAKNSSFIISPEAGISVSRFQFACKFILLGTTANKTGVDVSSNNQKLLLESIKAQQVFLTASYKIFQF